MKSRIAARQERAFVSRPNATARAIELDSASMRRGEASGIPRIIPFMELFIAARQGRGLVLLPDSAARAVESGGALLYRGLVPRACAAGKLRLDQNLPVSILVSRGRGLAPPGSPDPTRASPLSFPCSPEFNASGVLDALSAWSRAARPAPDLLRGAENRRRGAGSPISANFRLSSCGRPSASSCAV